MTAALSAGWDRWAPRVLAGPMGSSRAGVPLLPLSMPNARLVVEIAWGADLAASEETWPWVDVTTDVRQDPGLSWDFGRNDEASTSQPASCSMRLDNTCGDYTQGGQSRRYPYVRRNTPVRVRIDPDGTGFQTAFLGFATGFTPSWNLTGSVREVVLESAGTLRRLIQGSSPLASSIRRAMLVQPSLIAYWPCEDGKNATQLAAAFGSTPMTFTSTLHPAEVDVFDCSAPLVNLNGATLSGAVGAYTTTSGQQVRALVSFPADEQVDKAPIIRVFTSGSITQWDICFDTGGALELNAYDRFGTKLVSSGPFGFAVKNNNQRLSLQLTQNGTGIDWGFGTTEVDGSSAVGFVTGNAASNTVGVVVRVVVNPTGGLGQVGFGHLTVQNIVTSLIDVIAELNANAGEITTARLARLCSENHVSYVQSGFNTNIAAADMMGPQAVANLVTLLREAELADQGALYDGVSGGLAYSTRRYREDAAAALTLDAAAGQLSSPFTPTDDDQRTRNKVTVTRTGGSSATFEDAYGPLGTAAVGIYDDSTEVNTFADSNAALYAGWLVSQGTVVGYRYPTITLDLEANPQLAAKWLALRPGMRVDIANLGSVLPGHAADTVSLVVEGISNEVGAGGWTGTAKCSPYRVWRVGIVAAETGETSEYSSRVDTDGASLGTAATPGATSLSVASTGALWSTNSDDYPLDLDVGGVKVTATSCSGASSPQTFTVAALAVLHPAGQAVALWAPTVAGL